MSAITHRLTFERPLLELQARLEKLEGSRDAKSPAVYDEIRRLRRQLADETKKVYSSLDAWQTVQVARHPERPGSSEYLNLSFDEFVELHGDRAYGDDRALRTGFAKIDQYKVMFAGHFKGKTTKERTACHFGCAHPEGYRKAMEKMQMAAKFRLPVVCFIDTPGAYPGIGAEERGQSYVIAKSMFEMSRLKTPIICIVIGEGGSGGALGIGVGDRVAMLEHSYYSVISPEGCAGILWKGGEHAEKAAKALRITSKDLPKYGIVDDVIEEPLGGAHRDHHQMALRMKQFLVRTLKELTAQDPEQLVAKRYQKFRKMGVYLENMEAEEAVAK